MDGVDDEVGNGNLESISGEGGREGVFFGQGGGFRFFSPENTDVVGFMGLEAMAT